MIVWRVEVEGDVDVAFKNLHMRICHDDDDAFNEMSQSNQDR